MVSLLKSYWNSNVQLQKLHDEFIENTITNFYLPMGVAPNFVINKKTYAVPMVIEESSVVAAASNAAKFWSKRGGFKAAVLATEKIGNVHFMFNGSKEKLVTFIEELQSVFRNRADCQGLPLAASEPASGNQFYQLFISPFLLEITCCFFLKSVRILLIY